MLQGITLLGTRGTLPVSGSGYSTYGGDTSCYLVRLGGETVILDGGSGLGRASALIPEDAKKLAVLLSHAHIDHILGLPFFAAFYRPGLHIDLYAAPRSGLDVRAQVAALMSPPFWPVGPESFTAQVACHDLPDGRFWIGEVAVDTMEGSHPGGCTVFSLTGAGRKIVYCTDYEHDPASLGALADFARGASVLLYDAHFSDQEYACNRGWGHSTWQTGAELGKACGAERTVLIHHHPSRTDAQIEAAQRSLAGFPGVSFGKCGEEIAL